MSVKPKDLYSGQIDETDVGYPYGKAKNVAVAGDGSGTPFEKGWLNDLWGWMQALLYDASVTPSGTPDKVGASDYLQAIKNIADARAALLVNQVLTWTGINTFSAQLRADGGIRLGTNPVVYSTFFGGLLIVKSIPLRLLQPAMNSSMKFFPESNRILTRGDGSNALMARAPILLPHNASILGFRAAVKPNATDDTIIQAHRYTPDKSDPVTLTPSVSLTLTAPVSVAGGAGITYLQGTLTTPETVNNATSEYFLNISTGSSNASDAEIHWVDVAATLLELNAH